MSRIKVGVLRGGPSREFDISLETGKTVLASLPEHLYEPIDIFIDKQGVWHRGGVPLQKEQVLLQLDVVFNALHGVYGEDGRLQTELEKWGIPYTGSTAFASTIGLNKILTKEYLLRAGIKTPYFKVLKPTPQLDTDLIEAFRSLPPITVAKPYNSGSSLGVSLNTNFEELKRGISRAFEHAECVIVEEFIEGKEGTMGIIDNFRGREHYPLFPVEIRPRGKSFFDYEAKYSGMSDEIVPGHFSREEVREIEEAVLKAHRELGLRHYSRTDFIVHPKRGVFILEVNTLPGLTEGSLFPKSLKAIGLTLPNFLHHLLQLALGK